MDSLSTSIDCLSPVVANEGDICHGRVKEDDFERMVPAQWWKTVFADGLYLKTDGDVVEDPEITREEIRFHQFITYTLAYYYMLLVCSRLTRPSCQSLLNLLATFWTCAVVRVTF